MDSLSGGEERSAALPRPPGNAAYAGYEKEVSLSGATRVEEQDSNGCLQLPARGHASTGCDKGKKQISTRLTFLFLGKMASPDGTQYICSGGREGWSPKIDPSCVRLPQLQTSGLPLFGRRSICVSESITVRRLPLTLRPNSSRVLLRPFFPDDHRGDGREAARLGARTPDSLADSRLVRRTRQCIA